MFLSMSKTSIHPNPKTPSKSGSIKITLTIPELLLEDVDATAKRDYATRSDVIRQALVDYIRQYELARAGMEPEEAFRGLATTTRHGLFQQNA